MDYISILERIKDQYSEILKENLVGIYVHGSIAFHCYNSMKSDIDFLVVVNTIPTLEQKMRLIQVLLGLTKVAPPKGLEMSVVLKEVCQHFVYPTPFCLHFSNLHLKRCQEELMNFCETMNGNDPDLAAHFTVTKAVGYPLVGAPIDEVFGEIPKQDYLDSIKLDIENAVEEVSKNPVYIILNLCRVLAYISLEQVMSKEQGGEWGIHHVPEKYREIVEAALREYRDESETKIATVFDEHKTKEFANYMLRCIFKTEY